MKTSKDFMKEANAVVPKMGAEDAVKLHGTDTVFVDVRDSAAIADTGTIAGAYRIPRGLLEFKADSESPLHDAAMEKDAQIALICAAGGQAALAGKTLIDMGYTNVVNIGGFKDWKAAGGAVEEG